MVSRILPLPIPCHSPEERPPLWRGALASLGPNDGIPGSGTDFTTCSFVETLPITCSATQHEHHRPS